MSQKSEKLYTENDLHGVLYYFELERLYLRLGTMGFEKSARQVRLEASDAWGYLSEQAQDFLTDYNAEETEEDVLKEIGNRFLDLMRSANE